ncbi:MAG: hypothetical protein H6730_30650 [Deltaproteobacteria bacterium]|nr:hypothetical protein [Deltaproteobacteria bacterium]
MPDTGAPDSGTPDSGTSPDSGIPDAGPPDAGTEPDGGGCPVRVPAPDVDPWSVRLPAAGFGGVITQTNGGHQDVLLKSPAPQLDYTRVGVRLDWGGTIVFWGLSANPASNTIDANDTGREVQIALYDPERNRQPCAWNASCLSSSTSCGNSITYLGWNPVQGGDECNRGAATTWATAGDALRVMVTPVQWNPDWDATDCRNSGCGGAARPAQVSYLMDLRFVTPLVVELSLEVQSAEAFDHGVTGQEFPTMYVSHGSGGPDLPLLLDASGTAIAIDQPANDGFTMKNFTSPAPWVTFQNTSRDYGVGLAMDQGVTLFQGWAGSGSGAPYFHNVRARLAFGLGAGATVRGRAYLALGGAATISASLTAALAQRPAFGWVDAPAPGTQAQGASVTVGGWALSPTGQATVTVELDGQPVATLPVDRPRPDVCQIYPAYTGCPAVGFSGTVSLAGLDACAHVLSVVATTPAGVRTVLGERLVQR